MAKLVSFTDGKFSVYFSPYGGENSYLVAACDSVEVALGVALNLHHLSNSPHVVTVEDPRFVEVASLKRLDFIPLKLQSNGR